MLPFADAAAAAPASDGAILVVRFGKAHITHVEQAAEALRAVGTPLLGSVLTMTPAKRYPEYSHGHGSYRARHPGDGASKTTAGVNPPIAVASHGRERGSFSASPPLHVRPNTPGPQPGSRRVTPVGGLCHRASAFPASELRMPNPGRTYSYPTTITLAAAGSTAVIVSTYARQ